MWILGRVDLNRHPHHALLTYFFLGITTHKVVSDIDSNL